jgi:hypothetical protein
MRDVRTKLKKREKEPQQREMVGAEEREESDGNGWPGMAQERRREM